MIVEENVPFDDYDDDDDNSSFRCHFDPSIFIKSDNISGGICDDCAHNTMGTNCELCRPGYYQVTAIVTVLSNVVACSCY